MMVQKYGFDEFGLVFGPREDGVYCDIDDYAALEREKQELAEKVKELEYTISDKQSLINLYENFDNIRIEELEAENTELRKRLEPSWTASGEEVGSFDTSLEQATTPIRFDAAILDGVMYIKLDEEGGETNMLLAKKFKTKLRVNVAKINGRDIFCCGEIVHYGITREDVIEWLDKQWTEFLEQQIIPKKQKRRA